MHACRNVANIKTLERLCVNMCKYGDINCLLDVYIIHTIYYNQKHEQVCQDGTFAVLPGCDVCQLLPS